MAVDAHLARQPRAGSLGPSKKLVTDLLAAHSPFGAVFLAFCKPSPAYGSGDLQVKRLYDELQNRQP